MKTVLKTSLLAAALSFSLVACDSAAEDAAENQIDAQEDAANAQIDAMEDSGQVTDAQADAMEGQVEADAQAKEDALDATDPDTPAEAAAATEAAER
jgi:opacity protein-like surface antigen